MSQQLGMFRRGRMKMICRLIRFQAVLVTSLFVLTAWIWHETIDAASLQLSWSDNSQNEDGFDIERKTGTNGTFLALTTVGANESSYTDANLSNGTTIVIAYALLTRPVIQPTPTRPARPPLLPPQHHQALILSPPISPMVRRSAVLPFYGWPFLPVFQFGSNFLSTARLARQNFNPRINSMVIRQAF